MTVEPKVRKARVKRVRPDGTTPARFRYRAYPDAAQRRMLGNLFGCTRVAYNDFIAARRTAFAAGAAFPTHKILSAQLTASKNTPERAWLKDVPAVPLQQSIGDADTAYRNFFASIKGERKGRKVGAPKFRTRKSNYDSARFTSSNAIVTVRRVSGNRAKLTLTGVPGEITLAWSRDIPSAPSSATVIKEADGRYYVSFVVDRPTPEPLAPNGRVVGIDLGLTTLATLVDSDENASKVEPGKHFRKAQIALSRAQRTAAQHKTRAAKAGARVKASGRPAPAVDPDNRRRGVSATQDANRRRVAGVHRRVRESRLDGHHKLALQIVSENQTVVLETLSITGLARTPLAKSVHDVGWGILVRLIEEKAKFYGRTVVRVDRFFPSSKMCPTPGCNFIWKSSLPLDVREWECPTCDTLHDRDVAAATNLRNTVAGGCPETQNGRRDNDPRLAKPCDDRATVDETTNPTPPAGDC